MTGIKRKVIVAVMALAFTFHLSPFTLRAQAPGTTPVKVSTETQTLHGRKYYVHIVETGQTVYSISKAYKVESYDAVTHVDIHFLHAGDTVWLPVKGQFAASSQDMEREKQEAIRRQTEERQQKSQQQQKPQDSPSTPPPAQYTPRTQNTPSTQKAQKKQESPSTPPARTTGKVLKVSLLMPLHLDQIDEISTSKFDVEQRGKKSYKQFEFIEFYEGIRLALDHLAGQGISVELNVADVSENNAAAVEKAFRSHNAAEADAVVALLFRDAFSKAAALAKEAGVYIVNPMSTRSEICADNAYVVKIQPSMESQIETVLDNMATERPEGHLYIIHSGAATEKPVLDELKRQLTARKDLKYTLFNWNQSNKLTQTLKATPGCSVISICDLKADKMRVYVGNVLNRLSAIKSGSPTFYTLSDWTRDYPDVDFAQLQLLNYHTFSTAWDMTNSVHVDFLKEFRERYGSEPTSTLAATGYDLTLYILRGLNRRNSRFWEMPDVSLPELVHPLHLSRHQAGLENDQPQLFRMESLRFVPIF